MRRICLAVICLLFLGVGFAEWQLRVLRADYQQGQVGGRAAVRVAAWYLPARQLFLTDPGAAIATAFHVARQPGAQDFPAAMRQAVLGLGMLRDIFLDSKVSMEWKNEAAFEALTLLVRMPWDDALAREALQLSVHLQTALLQEPSATLDEAQMVKDLLSLVAARQGRVVVPGVHSDTVPADEQDAWRRGLQSVRLGLARCVQIPEPSLAAAWAALDRGFGQNWLRQAWVAGWDSGLLQTIQAAHVSADCQRLAARFSFMAAVAVRLPQ